MVRTLSALLLVALAAVLLAPTMVLVQFKLDQERIASELCVQRDRMEGMRDCHGECQLTKRFKALEQESEAGFPSERIEHRWEPVFTEPLADDATATGGRQVTMGWLVARTLDGVPVNPDPVPWA